MRILKQLIWSVPLLIILTACPYESTEILQSDKGVSREINDDIEGTWVFEAGEDSVVMKITKKAPGLFIDLLDQTGEESTFNGVVSKIDGNSIINLTNNVKKPTSYYYVRYELKGDKMKIYFAADKFVESNIAQSSLTEFFKTNMNKKGLWTNDMTFEKR